MWHDNHALLIIPSECIARGDCIRFTGTTFLCLFIIPQIAIVVLSCVYSKSLTAGYTTRRNSTEFLRPNKLC